MQARRTKVSFLVRQYGQICQYFFFFSSTLTKQTIPKFSKKLSIQVDLARLIYTWFFVC